MSTQVWRVLGAGAALAGGAAAYATWVEPRWFALRRFAIPCLPAGSPSLRVLGEPMAESWVGDHGSGGNAETERWSWEGEERW